MWSVSGRRALVACRRGDARANGRRLRLRRVPNQNLWCKWRQIRHRISSMLTNLLANYLANCLTRFDDRLFARFWILRSSEECGMCASRSLRGSAFPLYPFSLRPFSHCIPPFPVPFSADRDTLFQRDSISLPSALMQPSWLCGVPSVRPPVRPSVMVRSFGQAELPATSQFLKTCAALLLQIIPLWRVKQRVLR